MDIFLDKHGLKEETKMNEPMAWGIALEAPIADRYATQNNVKLRQGAIVMRDGWRGGTPDRIIVDQPKGLEIKTSSIRNLHLWGDVGTDDVPTNYLMQCAWYMSLCDFQEWDLAVLIGGQEYRQYTIRRNKALEDNMISLADDFYRAHVLRDDPPQIDNSEGSNRWLKSRHPSDSIPKLAASNRELDALALQLASSITLKTEIESEIELMQNKIKLSIGDNQGVVGEDWKATWKLAKARETTDWQALALELGATSDMILHHKKVGESSRRFTFKHNSSKE
jgi:putative phage-type endonuclease